MTTYDNWKCRDPRDRAGPDNVNVGKEVECPMCWGRGYRAERKCRLCGGNGAVDERIAAEWAPDEA
jgi:DnaJ-class molecular chaperone